MRDRVIYFEVAGETPLGTMRIDQIGSFFAKIEDVELCNNPKKMHVAAFRIRSDMNDDLIASLFQKVSKRKVKIITVKDKRKKIDK